MAQFSLNNVHKRGIKHHHFIFHGESCARHSRCTPGNGGRCWRRWRYLTHQASTPQTTLLTSLSTGETTSPNWWSSRTDPRDVADEYGRHSHGVFLSNVNTTTPGTATAVLISGGTSIRHVQCALSCAMYCPQYVHIPTSWLLRCCLHSRRNNSRSPCRLLISDSRDGPQSPEVTHFRRRDCRTGHVDHVKLWKPWGFALASGMSTRTLFWALLHNTQTGSASS